MKTRPQVTTVYIDALALCQDRKSGVGVTLEKTLQNLTFSMTSMGDYRVCLFVPLGKRKYVEHYVNDNVSVKVILMPARVVEVLLRLGLMPPIDWVLGKGVYVFPNYRNFPVWRSRSLTYIYDLAFIRFPFTVQPKNLKYLRRYIRRWTARTDRVITISNQVKYEIEKYLAIPESNVRVVYCGVDVETFYKREKREVTLAKQKYNIPYENYFLFVGNIEPRKNVMRLLEAYSTLSVEVRDKHGLVIIGGGGWLNDDFYRRLEELKEKGLNVIKINKYVSTDDLPALYSGSSGLVHPALYEGFGITPLEAAACQVPVVVSDMSAVHEVLQGGAYYCDPESVESIRLAVEKMVKDSSGFKKHVIEDGLERANVLSWPNTARELETVLKEMVSLGYRRRPVVGILKKIYVSFDAKIRSLLGDKAYEAYIPGKADNQHELSLILRSDFQKEQPNLIQHIGLKSYIFARHMLSTSVRKAVKAVR